MFFFGEFHSEANENLHTKQQQTFICEFYSGAICCFVCKFSFTQEWNCQRNTSNMSPDSSFNNKFVDKEIYSNKNFLNSSSLMAQLVKACLMIGSESSSLMKAQVQIQGRNTKNFLRKNNLIRISVNWKIFKWFQIISRF